jgi:CheY-like chemotaxis protein
MSMPLDKETFETVKAEAGVDMRTILVIDDETGITQVIQEALRMVGYEVEVASNGKEGIRKFDHRPYDLVITDICMPGVNGDSVARHIRHASNGNTAIIGISGTPWMLENDDFDMVLSKPFPLEDLIASVQQLPAAGSDPAPL